MFSTCIAYLLSYSSVFQWPESGMIIWYERQKDDGSDDDANQPNLLPSIKFIFKGKKWFKVLKYFSQFEVARKIVK